LPGIITSVVSAYEGFPRLAMSNAIGGVAAQTLFLSIADISYPKINLEHAAASFANLMQGVLLIVLFAFVLVGMSSPEFTFWHIHPFSFLLLMFYILGMRLISRAKDYPMWNPKETKETVQDVPDDKNIKHLNKKKVTAKFLFLALMVSAAGFTVAKTGIQIAEHTGLSESFVGSMLTAVATSLPELIVSIASIKQRALTLAVSNIIGGNSFDVLFVAFSDFAYLDGSIYHAATNEQLFTIALTMLMTGILLLGLLHREKKGIAQIGWESFLVILIYLLGNAYLFFM
jgi:cation:H+ antiporter